jgi:hypothetical protein
MLLEIIIKGVGAKDTLVRPYLLRSQWISGAKSFRINTIVALEDGSPEVRYFKRVSQDRTYV